MRVLAMFCGLTYQEQRLSLYQPQGGGSAAPCCERRARQAFLLLLSWLLAASKAENHLESCAPGDTLDCHPQRHTMMEHRWLYAIAAPDACCWKLPADL